MEDQKKTNVEYRNERDKLFIMFLRWMIATMLLFGAGTMLEIFFVGDDSVSSRLISAFGSIFVAVLGLGTGYLFGSRTYNDD